MTDNEIIKALECCVRPDIVCEKCSCSDGNGNCSDAGEMLRGALKIINRQKAEIERLQENAAPKCEQCVLTIIKKAESEAVERFVDKVKFIVYEKSHDAIAISRIHNGIDNLVKEMTERKE